VLEEGPGDSQDDSPTDRLTPSTGCPTPDEEGLEEGVVPYEICSDLEPETIRNVSDPGALASSIIKIVNIEGPIEKQLAIDRLRSLVRGVSPSTHLPKESIEEAIIKAKQGGKIFGRGEFLWPEPSPPIKVRKRTDPLLARLEEICDEEIEAAIKGVIRNHGRQTQKALTNEVYVVLGVIAYLAPDSDRMAGLIRHLLERGDLQEEPNGLIVLPPY